MSTGAVSQTIVGRLAVELGMSDEQFRAALNRASSEAEKAAAKIQSKVSQASNQVAKAANGGAAKNAMGLLNLSRAIDDVQYGFSGIVNNIEGIVTGFGFSAGIAGAATIAGVAINALLPRMLDLVSTRDPMRELADAIRSIEGSGISGTFAGMAAEAKATQAAFEASAEVLEKMRTARIVNREGQGPATRESITFVRGNAAEDIFAQRIRVNELAQEAARDAFRANQQRQRIAMGGLAGLDLTTEQQERIKLNQQVFQAAVDRFGGGQQLFDALKIKNLGGAEMFGAFKEGDVAATNKAVELLGLQPELKKVMSDHFERVTGEAEELRRIEEQTAKNQQQERIRQGRIADRQFDEYERGVSQYDRLVARRDSIMSNLNRSEILGSAADVFARNVNAGQKSDELKQLEEINEGIKNLKPQIGLG